MGLNDPPFDAGAEQAVRPITRSISARNVMWSPARLIGGKTSSFPVSPFTGTFMKQLNAVGIRSGTTPNGSSAAARLPKHPRCTGRSG